MPHDAMFNMVSCRSILLIAWRATELFLYSELTFNVLSSYIGVLSYQTNVTFPALSISQ